MANFRKFRLPIRIYQLRIELTKIDPTIWRNVLVPDTIKLSKLDRVIQESFGWTNSHLTPNQTNYWPMCITGENACPPEDVGGPSGYIELIEILNGPTHAQHAELFHWVGGPFDPRSFDVNSANARIGRIR
jgi:hypothetical protein